MKFVQSILLRYYFLFKKDFIINSLLFFLFPIISFIFIVLPFSKIIKVSFLEINIDYISWVCIPFLYFTSSLFSMIIASESTNEYIYRNFLVESIKTTSIKLIYLLISILVFSITVLPNAIFMTSIITFFT